MAVAGSAPAYSIAGSHARVIVARRGVSAGPAALLWCGIPMFGIAIAYHQLNKMGANAGAAYSWVGRVIHPFLGFLTGWAVVVSATIFMVAASIPAGNATLSLFSEHLAGEAQGLGTRRSVPAVWFLVMAYFVARGVRITANAQWIMSSIEVVLLVLFAVLGRSLTATRCAQLLLQLARLQPLQRLRSESSRTARSLRPSITGAGMSRPTSARRPRTVRTCSGVGGIVRRDHRASVLFELFTIVMNMDLSQKAMVNQQRGQTSRRRSGQRGPGNSLGAKLAIIALMLSTIATPSRRQR